MQLGASPKDVASRAMYTFATLSDPQAVVAVVNGPDGVAAGEGAHDCMQAARARNA